VNEEALNGVPAVKQRGRGRPRKVSSADPAVEQRRARWREYKAQHRSAQSQRLCHFAPAETRQQDGEVTEEEFQALLRRILESDCEDFWSLPDLYDPPEAPAP